MKITEAMVSKACEQDYLERGMNWRTDPGPQERRNEMAHMRRVLETTLDLAERADAHVERIIREDLEQKVEEMAAELRMVHNELLVSNDSVEEIKRHIWSFLHKIGMASSKRRGGYEGPGVYVTYTGLEWEVLGRVGRDGGVIMRNVGDDSSGSLFFETWNEFNSRRENGQPTYTYVRPLESWS